MASRFAIVKEDTILAANETVVPRMPQNLSCRCLLVGRTLFSYFYLIFFSPSGSHERRRMCSFGGWRDAMIGYASAFKGYPSEDICILLFIQNISLCLAGFKPRLIFHNQLALTKFGRSVDYTIIDVTLRSMIVYCHIQSLTSRKTVARELRCFCVSAELRKWWRSLVKEHKIAGFLYLR